VSTTVELTPPNTQFEASARQISFLSSERWKLFNENYIHESDVVSLRIFWLQFQNFPQNITISDWKL